MQRSTGSKADGETAGLSTRQRGATVRLFPQTSRAGAKDTGHRARRTPRVMAPNALRIVCRRPSGPRVYGERQSSGDSTSSADCIRGMTSLACDHSLPFGPPTGLRCNTWVSILIKLQYEGLIMKRGSPQSVRHNAFLARAGAVT